MQYLILAAAIAAPIAGIAACAIALRQARDWQTLRLLAEQTQSGLRGEHETTRIAIRAAETGSAERLAGLRGAMDVGTEQIRTAL